MLDEFPGVERAVSMSPFRFSGAGIVSYESKQVKSGGFFASKDFFKVFTYPILLGDNSGTMISKSLADKLFGSTEAAIGKMIEWDNLFWLRGPFIVSGVFADVPKILQASSISCSITTRWRRQTRMQLPGTVVMRKRYSCFAKALT